MDRMGAEHRVKEQQERGENVPPEVFRAEFEARVIGTGHVLSMLAPWSDPANLKRVWVAPTTLVVAVLIITAIDVAIARTTINVATTVD